MGEGARQENVLAVLGALEQELRKIGRGVKAGAAVTAALEAYPL
jgi:alanine-glyoxylate transaminase/serine-glyoxylate transaminase/serine-pyruvate transaminase